MYGVSIMQKELSATHKFRRDVEREQNRSEEGNVGFSVSGETPASPDSCNTKRQQLKVDLEVLGPKALAETYKYMLDRLAERR